MLFHTVLGHCDHVLAHARIHLVSMARAPALLTRDEQLISLPKRCLVRFGCGRDYGHFSQSIFIRVIRLIIFRPSERLKVPSCLLNAFANEPKLSLLCEAPYQTGPSRQLVENRDTARAAKCCFLFSVTLKQVSFHQ